VRVDTLRLLSFEAPRLRIEIECAKGFYVRSLAHDIGAALDVGGSLTALARTRVGSFDVGQAVSMETLKLELADGSWVRRLWAPDEVLLHWQALILGPENATNLRSGRAVNVGEEMKPDDRGLCRAYSADGRFLGIARREGEGDWRPEKVFSG
jgi:tRNA pseudouridine55 synthase